MKFVFMRVLSERKFYAGDAQVPTFFCAPPAVYLHDALYYLAYATDAQIELRTSCARNGPPVAHIQIDGCVPLAH